MNELQRRQSVGFYSLPCETYSGTSSSSCSVAPTCFYSLSCETYSARPDILNAIASKTMFLFAVVRDVQRNS